MKSERYPALDWLRLGLALVVVIGHVAPNDYVRGWNPVLPAVPIFLAISGFLIPRSFETSNGWAHFAWKRLLRVMPAMLLALLLIGAMRPADLGPTFGFYLRVGIGDQSTLDAPMWSLMLEELLYAAFCLERTVKLDAKFCAWAGLALSVGLWVAALHMTLPYGAMRPVGAVPSFFVGNLAGLYYSQLKALHWGWAIPAYCLALLGPPVAAYPLISLLVLLVALRINRVRHLPDLSYGLYIYHSPIAALTGLGLGVLPITLVVSALSWFGIESQTLKLKIWRPSQLLPKCRSVPSETNVEAEC